LTEKGSPDRPGTRRSVKDGIRGLLLLNSPTPLLEKYSLPKHLIIRTKVTMRTIFMGIISIKANASPCPYVRNPRHGLPAHEARIDTSDHWDQNRLSRETCSSDRKDSSDPQVRSRISGNILPSGQLIRVTGEKEESNSTRSHDLLKYRLTTAGLAEMDVKMK
jgi:hypothetical protein